MITELIFAASLLQSSAGLSDSEQEGRSAAEITTVKHGNIHALSADFKDYFECQMGPSEATNFGDLEVVTYEVRNSANCATELQKARSEFGASLYKDDPNSNQVMLSAAMQYYISHIEQLSLPATAIFVGEKSFGKSYTVPDGMWEYHVCKSDTVYLGGEVAEPLFPDDDNCDRSREYSRKRAISHLEEIDKPETAKERASLVDDYILEIDERTESDEPDR